MKTYIVKYILMLWISTPPNKGYSKQVYKEYVTAYRDSAYLFYNKAATNTDIKKLRLDSICQKTH